MVFIPRVSIDKFTILSLYEVNLRFLNNEFVDELNANVWTTHT